MDAIYGWASCGHDFRFPLPLTEPVPSELWCAQCKRTVALWAQSDGPASGASAAEGRSPKALKDLEPAGVGEARPACEHEWVDMRNEVIESGEWCPKCNAVRAALGVVAAAETSGSALDQRAVETREGQS